MRPCHSYEDHQVFVAVLNEHKLANMHDCGFAEVRPESFYEELYLALEVFLKTKCAPLEWRRFHVKISVK